MKYTKNQNHIIKQAHITDQETGAVIPDTKPMNQYGVYT